MSGHARRSPLCSIRRRSARRKCDHDHRLGEHCRHQLRCRRRRFFLVRRASAALLARLVRRGADNDGRSQCRLEVACGSDSLAACRNILGRIPDSWVCPWHFRRERRNPVPSAHPRDDRLRVADLLGVALKLRHYPCVFELDSVGPVLEPQIEYLEDSIVIKTRVKPGFVLDECRSPQPAIVPTLVHLAEPVGQRTLVDPGTEISTVRWQLPPPDAQPLPTKRLVPYVINQPIGMPGICADVGLDNSFLAGDSADPRLVWIRSNRGQGIGLFWPPGFTVTFGDGFEVRNEAGEVVHRDADPVENGACVVGSHGELSLYGEGYAVLD
jgi:hypothetical protein